MTIAVFDFDGTLVKCNSFLHFLLFSFKLTKICYVTFISVPSILLMKLGLKDNSVTKQIVFSHFFKGISYPKFAEMGHSFSQRLANYNNPTVIKRLKEHQDNGDKVYVISASVKEWVAPWCQLMGVEHVICTEAEVNPQGLLTGRFSTINCYGAEKRKRFLELEPQRSDYRLVVYGNSRGDHEMMQIADEAIKI